MARHGLAAWGMRPLSSDTISWQTRVIANSGTVSAAHLSAVNTAAALLSALGLTDANTRWNPFAGDQLAASLVPYWRGGGANTDTGVNVVGGDYAPATGITGNGVNSRVTTGLAPFATTGQIWSHLLQSVTTSPNSLMGCNDVTGTNTFEIAKNSAPTTSGSYGGALLSVDFAEGTMAAGLLVTVRYGTTDARLYRDGTQLAQSVVSTTATAPTATMAIFARNDNGTILNFMPTAKFLSGYGMSSVAVPTGSQAAFSSALNTLKSALGR